MSTISRGVGPELACTEKQQGRSSIALAQVLSEYHGYSTAHGSSNISIESETRFPNVGQIR
jgi:hypothetical protein